MTIVTLLFAAGLCAAYFIREAVNLNNHFYEQVLTQMLETNLAAELAGFTGEEA